MQAERRLAASGDLKIAYWERGNGKPLLLIMGLGLPAAAWGPLPDILADQGFRVITLDNRDCGSSSRCGDSLYSVADMAGDVLAVLDDAGFDRTNVIGISMGGLVAQELALNNPERVERLMLIATGPGVGGGVAPTDEILQAMFTWHAGDSEEAGMRRIFELLTGPGWVEKNRDLADAAITRRVSFVMDPAAMARQWTAVVTFSSWDRLDQIQCPVRLIHGDHDALVPVGNGEQLATRLPNAELFKLQGVGHLVPLEAPYALLEHIEEFFGSRSTSK